MHWEKWHTGKVNVKALKRNLRDILAGGEDTELDVFTGEKGEEEFKQGLVKNELGLIAGQANLPTEQSDDLPGFWEEENKK